MTQQVDYARHGGQGYVLTERPGAVTGYVVYLILMIVIYAIVALMGIAFFVEPAMFASGQTNDPMEMIIIGGVYAAMGLLLIGVYALPFFVGRRSWAWIYGIVLIAFGLTSCCLWPFLIPLIVYYVKAPARAWYGRT